MKYPNGMTDDHLPWPAEAPAPAHQPAPAPSQDNAYTGLPYNLRHALMHADRIRDCVYRPEQFAQESDHPVEDRHVARCRAFGALEYRVDMLLLHLRFLAGIPQPQPALPVPAPEAPAQVVAP